MRPGTVVFVVEVAAAVAAAVSCAKPASVMVHNAAMRLQRSPHFLSLISFLLSRVRTPRSPSEVVAVDDLASLLCPAGHGSLLCGLQSNLPRPCVQPGAEIHDLDNSDGSPTNVTVGEVLGLDGLPDCRAGYESHGRRVLKPPGQIAEPADQPITIASPGRTPIDSSWWKLRWLQPAGSPGLSK